MQGLVATIKSRADDVMSPNAAVLRGGGLEGCWIRRAAVRVLHFRHYGWIRKMDSVSFP